MTSINIHSSTKGLGGALSNTTELAFRKGSIKNRYPITWFGKTYEDIERAYQLNKTDDPAHNDALMIDLIAMKLIHYPPLFNAITKNGGATWLESCSHDLGPGVTLWSGTGRKSRFIRCLIEAYRYTLYIRMHDREADLADYEEETSLMIRLAGYHDSQMPCQA